MRRLYLRQNYIECIQGTQKDKTGRLMMSLTENGIGDLEVVFMVLGKVYIPG